MSDNKIILVTQSGRYDKLITELENLGLTPHLFRSGREVADNLDSISSQDLLLIAGDLEQPNCFDTILLCRERLPALRVILFLNFISVASVRLAAITGCDEVMGYPISPATMESLVIKYKKSFITGVPVIK